MNKKLKIFIFCMIFVAGGHCAQAQVTKNAYLLGISGHYFPTHSTAPISNFKPGYSVIAPSLYASRLGFFCRQEIKMDKKLAIPVRFRLGSIETCNWLEGKTVVYPR